MSHFLNKISARRYTTLKRSLDQCDRSVVCVRVWHTLPPQRALTAAVGAPPPAAHLPGQPAHLTLILCARLKGCFGQPGCRIVVSVRLLSCCPAPGLIVCHVWMFPWTGLYCTRPWFVSHQCFVELWTVYVCFPSWWAPFVPLVSFFCTYCCLHLGPLSKP